MVLGMWALGNGLLEYTELRGQGRGGTTLGLYRLPYQKKKCLPIRPIWVFLQLQVSVLMTGVIHSA